jgi:hypothetical protein
MTVTDPHEELRSLAASFRHLRAERARAGDGGSTRRHLEARMEETAERFRRRLGELVPDEADRDAWLAHLHHGGPEPEAPVAPAPEEAAAAQPDRPSGRRPWPR